MLILKRTKGQSVLVEDTRITLIKIEWNRVRLCVNGSEIIIRKLKSAVIKGGIIIKLCEVYKTEIRLGIDAPECMQIDREEMVRKNKENVL